jgi:hypothetical protein
LRNVNVPLVNLAVTCFDFFSYQLLVNLALVLRSLQSLLSSGLGGLDSLVLCG